MRVSGVPRRRFFLSDPLTYTVVTFSQPVSDCYRPVTIDEFK